MAATSDSVRDTHKSKRINHRHHWMHAVELLFPSIPAGRTHQGASSYARKSAQLFHHLERKAR